MYPAHLVSCVAILLLPFGLAAGADKAPSRNKAEKVEHVGQTIQADQVRLAVEKSLAFIALEGSTWIKERKCVSCHHVPFLLWSHNEARYRGLSVDQGKLKDWSTQAATLHLAGRQDSLNRKNGTVEATNLILGQIAPLEATGKLAEALTAGAGLMLNAQQADGSFKYEGQGQKRSDAEASETTTAWAIMALTAIESTKPDYAKNRARALAWLKAHQSGEGNEALLARLLLAHLSGDKDGTAKQVKLLIERQQADGGWSWSKDMPTDPYATGQSLYALGQAGVGHDSPAVQRAWRFLLSRQRPDGSWFAPSKKPKSQENVISSYWGTAWAAIGLVKTLPPQRLRAAGR